LRFGGIQVLRARAPEPADGQMGNRALTLIFPYFGAIRIAPSRRIVSAFSISISTMALTIGNSWPAVRPGKDGFSYPVVAMPRQGLATPN
jgi:hypothetical protein